MLPITRSLLVSALLVASSHTCAGVIAASVTRYNDTFQTMLRESMESAAERRGHELFVGDAEDNTDIQLEQLAQYVSLDVDALIVILVDSRPAYVQKVIDLAASKQIPLILLNRKPALESLPERVVFVGSNDNDAGNLEMEELARLANYQGKVALLRGPDNHPAAIARTSMVRDVIAKYPDMSLVVEETAMWRRNVALSKTANWLKEGADFTIVAANNDEMAIGAIMAIREAGKNPADYLIGGVDATPDALQAMSEGLLDVTVLQDARGQGQGAVSAAVNMMNGNMPESIIMVPFKLVTPDNLDRYKN